MPHKIFNISTLCWVASLLRTYTLTKLFAALRNAAEHEASTYLWTESLEHARTKMQIGGKRYYYDIGIFAQGMATKL